jgi:hypothetical protein
VKEQYDITVKIRVSVPTDSEICSEDYAQLIAKDYARMALQFKTIRTDKIVRVDVEKV